MRAGALALAAGLVAALLPLVSGAAGTGELKVVRPDWDAVRRQPGGEELIARELHRQGEYSRRWHAVHELVGPGHVSGLSRERLAKRGLGPALFGPDALAADKAAGTDTLRVLLVRIAFDENRNPGLTTISPDGDFMYAPLENPGVLEIDPPPHDKAYFEAHMAGLSEYYRYMSGGRLHIEGTVLPAGDRDAYRLSDVADYGPGSGGFWTLANLERLVQDCITTADDGLIADGFGNGLADYDDESPFTYVIFVHAGSDWQSDINGDSPNDIPTFFVQLGEPVDLGGMNPAGNQGRLSECSIIPETTNQDGYPGSIAAAFYHEFGHALGLPDVYNTEIGTPTVGIWDLMDSGTNLPVTIGVEVEEVVAPGDTVTSIETVVATGVLPPSLSAWCKEYLGWLEIDEIGTPVSSTGDYLLPAVGVPRAQYPLYDAGSGDFDTAYPQAYRAGLSPREYFLIENRWVHWGDEPSPFSEIRFERDIPTGVIQWLGGLTSNGWQNTGWYDYFMPAGGLLVWHVNAERIAAELETNTINIYGDGLRLVEADGIQDIGVLDAYVLGWFGSDRDPFGGLDIFGNETGYHDLYVENFPSSRNFDRSLSGLRLSNMTRRVPRTASVMKFNASLAPVRDGFPWEAAPVDTLYALIGGGTQGPRALDPASVTPLDLGGEQVLIVADRPRDSWEGDRYATMLFGLRPDATRRWAEPAGLPPGAFQSLSAPLAGPPAVVDHPTDGKILLWGLRDGQVGATHLPAGAAPSLLWSVDLADSLTCAPRVVRAADGAPRLLVATPPDSLRLLAVTDGSPVGAPQGLGAGPGIRRGHLVVLPFGEGRADQAVLLGDASWFTVRLDDTGLLPDHDEQPYRVVPAAAPAWAAARPTDDGDVDLAVFGPEGELARALLTPQMAVTTRPASLALDGEVVCAPAVADVDGDGRHDMLVATATRIYGFKEDGVPLRGFPVRFADLYPLADSTRIAGPLVVADGTGEGAPDVWFNSTGGHLLGLDPTGRLLPGLPVRWGDAGTGGLAVGGDGAARILWLVSAGGYRTGFQARQGVNGRVAAWDFPTGRTADGRTAEWLGPDGGPA
ncbi:immune inhibitor A, partial [bacterium]|nr:immune inhibitor A [bacterium]